MDYVAYIIVSYLAFLLVVYLLLKLSMSRSSDYISWLKVVITPATWISQAVCLFGIPAALAAWTNNTVIGGALFIFLILTSIYDILAFVLVAPLVVPVGYALTKLEDDPNFSYMEMLNRSSKTYRVGERWPW